MTHQLATGRTATLIKLAFAAGAKTAAFAAFALTALVTRNMPNDEAGLFLLGFTLLTVLSIFFRLGLDNVILRFLSAHGTEAARLGCVLVGGSIQMTGFQIYQQACTRSANYRWMKKN